MEEILFKLDDFCAVNRIYYVVTGTLALALLGIPSGPKDIDVKVPKLNEEQKEKLKELQFLAGVDEKPYESNTCYTIIINGVKINFILSEINASEIVTLDIIDEKIQKVRPINVQQVLPTLKDKMKLNREKDKSFMLNLISVLSAL